MDVEIVPVDVPKHSGGVMEAVRSLGSGQQPSVGSLRQTWKVHDPWFGGEALSEPDKVTVVHPVGNTSPLWCDLVKVGFESQASTMAVLNVTA
jgi:hypothetical protein